MSSGCPVNFGKKTSVNSDEVKSVNNDSKCPVKDDSKISSGYDESINDEIFGQELERNQSIKLSTSRAVSTIPKGLHNPSHQPENVDKWVYPSEQQYYNAMRRKGYKPSESDIPAVLYIHNMVNEQGWNHIKEWELLLANKSPILQRFVGRPKDMSPKALFMSFLGYTLPFDRHDWYINRNGKEVRYVIDFYKGSKRNTFSPVAIYLDVRPALDSFSSVSHVLMYYWKKSFSPWSIPKL